MENVINSYRDLEVWKKAMELVTDIYKVTQTFVKEEIYGLTSQVRRAAVSVPANIAEGWGRGTTKEYMQFLRIEINKMMNALISSLKHRLTP